MHRQHAAGIWLGVVLLLLGIQHPATALTLERGDAITLATASPAVACAAHDVARNFTQVLGGETPVRQADNGKCVVSIDPTIPGPEGYRITISNDGVLLAGADALGAVYALYDFSHRFLGVDPLWYWTGRLPATQASVTLAPAVITAAPPRFRYRGLFLNDEDLLGRWRTPAGERFADYPDREKLRAAPVESSYEQRLVMYYFPVINREVMDAVYETMLRLHGNLVIPASFVDVMNPAEAALISAAVARGLYVSQHHVEPMGVSFFAYNAYWARQGKQTEFSYPREQALFAQCWKAYADKWHALAGDQLIWQIGLRGRGDRSVWQTDPLFDRAKAGDIISEVLATQMRIIHEVDPRPSPPTTLTLWLEMNDLLVKGQLRVPEGVTLINTDAANEPGRAMNPSFTQPRAHGAVYGSYLHVALWNMGPHLVQGIDHDALAGLIDTVAKRGDTSYLLVNAANVREHILSLRTAMDRSWQAGAATALTNSIPAAAAPLYRRLTALQRLPGSGNSYMHDGACRKLLSDRLLKFAGDRAPTPLDAQLQARADELTALANQADALPVSAADARFVQDNLAVQARILAHLYRATAAVQQADAQVALTTAKQELAAIQQLFAGQHGPWEHWYRGDTKIHVAYLLAKIDQLLLEKR